MRAGKASVFFDLSLTMFGLFPSFSEEMQKDGDYEVILGKRKCQDIDLLLFLDLS
jgi:hypothetical protein